MNTEAGASTCLRVQKVRSQEGPTFEIKKKVLTSTTAVLHSLDVDGDGDEGTGPGPPRGGGREGGTEGGGTDRGGRDRGGREGEKKGGEEVDEMKMYSRYGSLGSL